MSTIQKLYETYVPSGREWDAGSFPVKKFQAQNGAELKILYGDRITSRTLRLTYNNINDKKAEEFMEHYIKQHGTFKSFTFNANISNGVFAGWTGGLETINQDGALSDPKTVKWAYASAPVIRSVYRGLSNLTVELVATF